MSSLPALVHFPLIPNQKKPKFSGWNKLTKTPTFGWCNGESNKALLLGRKLGLATLDIDTKDEGLVTWNKLIEKHGEPQTWTQDTPSGGIHYIFKHPECALKRRIKMNGVGIDFLPDNSYIVCEPSTINGKAYKFRNGIEAIQEMPSWLFEYINRAQNESEAGAAEDVKKPNINHERGQYQKLPFNVKQSEVVKYLKRVPIEMWDKYDSWFKLTCALKSEGLRDLWVSFSKTSARFDADKNDAIWDSINPIVDINYLGQILQLKKPLFKPFRQFKPISVSPDFTMNEKYLNPTIYEGHRTIAISSCTGTGKTVSTSAYIKSQTEEANVLSIVPRICLADAHAEAFSELGMISYTKVDSLLPPNRFSVQLDSIGKYQYGDLSNTILYLDEMNSTITYLLQSDTLNNKRRNVFRELCRVIKEAKQVIATDADMSDMCLNFLNRLRGDCFFVHNQFQNCKNIFAFNYKGEQRKNRIIAVMKQHVKNNKPFVCCTDTKADADMIYHLIMDNSKKDMFVLHTSESMADISNINELWKGKFVIYSPKIIYGLDFVPEVAQPVFVVSRGMTISPLNIVQQVARTRKISELHYAVSDGTEWCKFRNINDVKKHYSDNIESYVDTFSQMGCVDETEAGELRLKEESLFSELFFMYQNYNDIFRTNRLRHFEDIITSKGFVIIDACVRGAEKIDWKEVKKEVRIEHMELYKEVVEGICTDKDFAKAVHDRWEIVNLKEKEDRLKHGLACCENRYFTEHLLCSKALEDVEKLEGRVKTNATQEFKVKFLSNDLMKLKMLKAMEGHLDIAPFLVTNDGLEAAIDMKDSELKLIKTTFRVRSNITTPKTRKELLPLYAKCANQVAPDWISAFENQVWSGVNRGKREYTYFPSLPFMKIELDLLKFRNPSLLSIDKRVIEAVYGIEEEADEEDEE